MSSFHWEWNHDITLTSEVVSRRAHKPFKVYISRSQMDDCMELLLQEHVFKPESSLITQVLTAKSGFKFRGESRKSQVE